MKKIERVVLATGNAGKVKEFSQVWEVAPWEIVPQSVLRVQDVEETGLTYVENALIKARHAAKETGLPAMADDSGLMVDALGGAPGLYSAYYAGRNVPREAHIEKLLANLKQAPEEKRTARFVCVLVFLMRFDDPLPLIATGTWKGRILLEPKGMQGFGYEPIFYVPTHQCSAGEISIAEKMRISHRGQAWQTLIKLWLARERHANEACNNNAERC